MASNYTQNYGLCQWEPGDSFTRTEFNRDNATLDGALNRAAKEAESANVNLYNLVLQQQLAGRYTGWKRALVFDGFQDDSQIGQMSEELVLSKAGRFVFLGGKHEENEDVRFGTRLSVTLEAGESLEESWACDRVGWSYAVRLNLSGQGTLVITGASGGFEKTVDKGSIGGGMEEVAFPFGTYLDPGETYTFRYTAKTRSVLGRDSGAARFGFRVQIQTDTFSTVETGSLVSKPYALGFTATGMRAVVRHSTAPYPLVSVLAGEEWLSLVLEKTYTSVYNLEGRACWESVYRLEQLPAGQRSLTVKLELGLYPSLHTYLYDYGFFLI